MKTSTWKSTERAIAKRLNGQRIPITGRQRGDVPDVHHDWLSIEVKHRAKLPAWLLDAMAQAVAAQREGQLPIVILHQSGERHNDDIVCVRLRDFAEWFGDGNGEKETNLPVAEFVF